MSYIESLRYCLDVGSDTNESVRVYLGYDEASEELFRHQRF